MTDAQILGNLAKRTFTLEKKCDVNVIHGHKYDHTTMIFDGVAKVYGAWMENGELKVSESAELHKGDEVVVKANVAHVVKNVGDTPVMYKCVFSHRDFDGVVSETYHGNDTAYEGLGGTPELVTALEGYLAKQKDAIIS